MNLSGKSLPMCCAGSLVSLSSTAPKQNPSSICKYEGVSVREREVITGNSATQKFSPCQKRERSPLLAAALQGIRSRSEDARVALQGMICLLEALRQGLPPPQALA